jgi:hypothetical protein
MKKTNRLLVMAALLGLSFATPAHAADQAEVIPYGHYLSGEGGLVVHMAELAAKNADGLHDALIKITGPQAYKAGIDGKTIRCRAERFGTGVAYVKPTGGYLMSSHKNSWGGWTDSEVYLGGKDGIDVFEEEKHNKDVSPLKLLEESKQP